MFLSYRGSMSKAVLLHPNNSVYSKPCLADVDIYPEEVPKVCNKDRGSRMCGIGAYGGAIEVPDCMENDRAMIWKIILWNYTKKAASSKSPSLDFDNAFFVPVKNNYQKPTYFCLQGTNDTSHEAHAKRVRDFYAAMLCCSETLIVSARVLQQTAW